MDTHKNSRNKPTSLPELAANPSKPYQDAFNYFESSESQLRGSKCDNHEKLPIMIPLIGGKSAKTLKPADLSDSKAHLNQMRGEDKEKRRQITGEGPISSPKRSWMRIKNQEKPNRKRIVGDYQFSVPSKQFQLEIPPGYILEAARLLLRPVGYSVKGKQTAAKSPLKRLRHNKTVERSQRPTSPRPRAPRRPFVRTARIHTSIEPPKPAKASLGFK